MWASAGVLLRRICFVGLTASKAPPDARPRKQSCCCSEGSASLTALSITLSASVSETRQWSRHAQVQAENSMSRAEAPLDALSREQKLLLLKRLRAKLKALAATLAAKQGLGAAAAAPAADASTGVVDADAVSAQSLVLPRPLAVHAPPCLAPPCDVMSLFPPGMSLLAKCPCCRQSEAPVNTTLAVGTSAWSAHHWEQEAPWAVLMKEPELHSCASQAPEAGKPPKRARLALKPKPAKPRAASKPRAAASTGAKRGGSPSDDECVLHALCSHLYMLRRTCVRCRRCSDPLLSARQGACLRLHTVTMAPAKPGRPATQCPPWARWLYHS